MLPDDATVTTEVSPTVHDQDHGPRGPQEDRGTCYAFAAATAIRSAQMRIFSRAVEKHESLVREITARFGYNGAPTRTVLDFFCPLKQLRYESLDEAAAARVVQSERPVIACFWLSEAGWRRFDDFFARNPDASLQAEDLSPPEERPGELEGHAVVIVGASDQDWVIKNSWGERFAFAGYFRVRQDALRFRFYDVFSYTSDLSRREIAAYCRAPTVLEISIQDPCRSDRNPISSLGWEIEFERMRIERVRTRNCSIARWNRQNPYKRVLPGYQIFCVNGRRDQPGMIWELHHADRLQVSLVVDASARIHDIFDDRARRFSFAHSAATGICRTQGRIFGRPVEQHGELVAELIERWGHGNTNFLDVLTEACRSRQLHWSELTTAADAEEVLQHRSIFASFALDSASWQAFQAQASSEAPHVVLRAGQIQNNVSEDQQGAAVEICGHGHGFWEVKDSLGGRIMVEQQALHFRYFDIFFYDTELSRDEISLFNTACHVLDFELRRQPGWKRGLETLGWAVNRDTLRIEWAAPRGRSPVGAHNMRRSPRLQILAGHSITAVNGFVEKDQILNELEHAVSLIVRIVRVHA